MLLGANLLFPEKKGGLPYDAEVEYLQGDGVAYIELDDRYAEYIKRAGISKGTSNTAEYFSGSFSGRHIHAFGSNADSVIICESYRTTYEASYVADGFAIYDLVADGTNFVISKDGVELASTPCTTKVPLAYSGHNLALFASKYYYTSGAITSIFTGRCSYFKVEDDNSLILDLIPVRKGSVGYMYDRVTGKLYGNAADSGAFIVGPDKGLPYDAEVEYLENDGSAWIDTGVSFAGDTLGNIDPVIISNFEILPISATTVQRCMYVGPSSIAGVGFGRQTGNIRCFIKGTSSTNAISLASVDAFENLKIDFDTANGYAYRDDAVIGSLARSANTTALVQGITMPIFAARYIYGGAAAIARPVANCIRVKYFYVKNNKTGASFDGIPVRVGTVGYFYDRISGQLFGNAADSGAFIVGPDK